MRSLLLLTALMVSALPVKADDQELGNRAHVIGALAATECLVRKGDMTEEQAKELMNVYVSKNPELDAAYSWATTSLKAQTALQVLSPYMNAQCDGFSLSEDESERLIGPYLN